MLEASAANVWIGSVLEGVLNPLTLSDWFVANNALTMHGFAGCTYRDGIWHTGVCASRHF